MIKRIRKEKSKKKNRICEYSGEIIHNMEKIIKEKYAKEYLEKLGYLVIKYKFVFLTTITFILIGGLIEYG